MSLTVCTTTGMTERRELQTVLQKMLRKRDNLNEMSQIRCLCFANQMLQLEANAHPACVTVHLTAAFSTCDSTR